MSSPSQDPRTDPPETQSGAVRVEDERAAQARQAVAAQSEKQAQEVRLEAEARAEEIRAEVAQTDARRAEEQVAKADEAVSQAEQERRRAQEERDAARERAGRAASDAQQVRHQAEGAGAGSGLAASTRAGGFDEPAGAQPIAFGPFTPERPELLVAAALVGGLVLARILRKMVG